MVADNTPTPIPLNPKKLTFNRCVVEMYFIAKPGAKIISKPPAIPEIVRQK